MSGKPPSHVESIAVDPSEFASYLRDDWLSGILSGTSEILETVLPFLEREAIDRIGAEGAVGDGQPPSRGTDPQAWREWWVREARWHCSTAGVIPIANEYLSPITQGAVNLLMASTRLRSAIEDGESEFAAGLGMLVVAEALSAGYSLKFDRMERKESAAYRKGVGIDSESFGALRRECIPAAAATWAANPALRTKDVARRLHARMANSGRLAGLVANGLTTDTIAQWLRDAIKAGALKAPPGAQKAGRPRKS